jgi:hypothetical protein
MFAADLVMPGIAAAARTWRRSPIFEGRGARKVARRSGRAELTILAASSNLKNVQWLNLIPGIEARTRALCLDSLCDE